MRKFLLVCLLIGLWSCNDGDIITIELDFDDTFQQCGDLVFYKTKTDPSESLSIVFSSSTSLEDLLAVDSDNLFMANFPVVFNYRTYDANLPTDYFCNDVPPSSVTILSDDESTGSTASITTILIEDDNDGVDASLEDIDNDGNPDNDDTDGDGLANYLDFDDDGDNVPTANENPDPNGDGLLDDAQDTDMDGIPDYLDDDDDGDGVLTRDEEFESQDQDPTNDIDNPSIGPDYLNNLFTMSVPATAYREHTIRQTFEIGCVVQDITLDNLTQQSLDFGTLTPSSSSGTISSRTITPPFN